jgi:hypothetical protein
VTSDGSAEYCIAIVKICVDDVVCCPLKILAKKSPPVQLGRFSLTVLGVSIDHLFSDTSQLKSAPLEVLKYLCLPKNF